jgi:hypothetical protein
MSRVCLECGASISGRRDKKFCDDQCRSAYNNKVMAEELDEVKRINQILKKNRKLLEDQLKEENMTKVPLKIMLKNGFDMQYHTHLYTTKAGSTYQYCYEYGYLPLEGDYLLIVKREKKSS